MTNLKASHNSAISFMQNQHNTLITQMRDFQNTKDSDHLSLNVFHNNDH